MQDISASILESITMLGDINSIIEYVMLFFSSWDMPMLCDDLLSSWPTLYTVVAFDVSLQTPSDDVKSKLPRLLKRMASLCDLRVDLAHLAPDATLPVLDEISVHKMSICYDASCMWSPVYPHMCDSSI